jgi:hypothetical protein
MKKFRKYFIRYIDILIILITGIITYWIYCHYRENIEVPIAFFGVGISIAFSLRQYRIENDKMFKELFVMYNDKYDRKFNNSLNKIVRKTKEDINYKLNKKEIPIITDYLNMCAEEYLWYTKGRIDPEAWKSWERGMKFYLFQTPIKRHIENEQVQKDSYYGIFEYLKILETAGNRR